MDYLVSLPGRLAPIAEDAANFLRQRFPDLAPEIRLVADDRAVHVAIANQAEPREMVAMLSAAMVYLQVVASTMGLDGEHCN